LSLKKINILSQILKHKSSSDEEETESGDFVETCIRRRDELAVLLDILLQEANDGELAAFASYAMAFPDGFTALVDTYEVLRCAFESISFYALCLY